MDSPNKLQNEEDIESMMEEFEPDESCNSKNVSLIEIVKTKPDIYGCVDCSFITPNYNVWADHDCDEYKK